MARPRKWRRICSMPQVRAFGPMGEGTGAESAVVMALDEYETIRLIDHENLNQEDCALQMGVARTTVQQIYAGARKKLAAVLVEGRPLIIEGGEIMLCDGTGPYCSIGGACRRGQGFGRGHGQGSGHHGGRRGRR
ncbi:MAG: DUF134 domain-containing protein [Christensenellales bacterium]